MKCYNCPMIKEEFDQRILRLDCSEYCGFIYWEDVESDHVDYCYCDKTGGKLCLTGRCNEAEQITEEEWDVYREEHGLKSTEETLGAIDDPLNDPINDPLKPTKKQKKRVRDKKYKEKQRRLYASKYKHKWFPRMWPVFGKDRETILYYNELGKLRYKQFLKKQSNRKIRRTDEVPKKGSKWKKLFDLDWELW